MTARGDIWSTTPWPKGWDVRHVAETASTNTDLVQALDDGTAGDRSVIATDHQTAGRGRLDRRWDAPAGTNLLVSIAFAPVPAIPVEATHRVGLAAMTAVRRIFPGADVALKWPNDVLLGERKLAGILAQRCSARDAVVVGLGLNVGWAPDGAASLDGAAAPAEVLRDMLRAIDDQPAIIRPSYLAALATIGRPIRVELPTVGTAGAGVVEGAVERFVEGTAVDVDDHGRLIVETAGGAHRTFDVGDIVHLRPA